MGRSKILLGDFSDLNLLVPLIMGVAFLLESCFGFGGAWITIPMLTLILEPKDAVFLMLVLQCFKALLLIPSWKYINWKALTLLPVGMVFGVIVGVHVLDIISPFYFRLGLAIYLLVFVTSDYVKINFTNNAFLKGKAGSLGAGMAGGFISGITGMGGPPYVVYLRTLELEKLVFRATMICVMSFSNFFRFAWDSGEILQNEVVRQYFFPCFIAFALASIIGSQLPNFISEKVYRHAVNAMLLGSALLLIYNLII